MQKRLKKILIKLIIIALCVGCLIFYLFQKRNYYCLAEDKCITVWKTAEGAFIIPGKYTSWFKPKDNYIKTYNLNEELGIYWFNNNPEEIVVDSYDYSIVNNNNKNKIRMLEYNKNPKYFKNLLYDADGLGDFHLKRTVSKLSINIKELYAITNDGRIFN